MFLNLILNTVVMLLVSQSALQHVLGQLTTLASVSECQAKNFVLCEE